MGLSCLIGFLGLCGFWACKKNGAPVSPERLFDSVPVVKSLVPLIDEISGIAASRLQPGYLWGLEDSGNPTQLYLLGHNGAVTRSVFLNGITNRDWEDMTLSGGYIYIAETGDNNEVYPEYVIYKFAEPDDAVDTVHQVEKINFTYEDGSHDCEAILVDSLSNDIYLFTKRDNPSRIYRISSPLQPDNVAVLIGQFSYTGIVSAAMAPKDRAIIIKTYGDLLYYPRLPTESISSALQKSPVFIPYVMEPQGEAICFALDNSGYFTLSEQGFSSTVSLYFYKRK